MFLFARYHVSQLCSDSHLCLHFVLTIYVILIASITSIEIPYTTNIATPGPSHIKINLNFIQNNIQNAHTIQDASTIHNSFSNLDLSSNISSEIFKGRQEHTTYTIIKS